MTGETNEIKLIDGEWFPTEQPVMLPDIRNGKGTYEAKQIQQIMYTAEDKVLTGYKCSRCDYANESPLSVRAHGKVHSKARQVQAAKDAEIAALQSVNADLLETLATYQRALNSLPEGVRKTLLASSKANGTVVSNDALASTEQGKVSDWSLQSQVLQLAKLYSAQLGGAPTFRAENLTGLAESTGTLSQLNTTMEDKHHAISLTLRDLAGKGSIIRTGHGRYRLPMEGKRG